MAYSKKGTAKYIAHLDLTRVFDRAMRRAGIKAAYSEGFNPHPKISFGAPLPVGVEGEREYIDIELKKEEELSDIVKSLQRQLPPGINIADTIVLAPKAKPLMAVINIARYEAVIPLKERISFVVVQKAVENWLSRGEVVIERFQKKKWTRKDIRPFVLDLEAASADNGEEPEPIDQFQLNFDLAMGNEGSVRPREVLKSIGELENLPLDYDGVKMKRSGLFIKTSQGKLLSPLEVSIEDKI